MMVMPTVYCLVGSCTMAWQGRTRSLSRAHKSSSVTIYMKGSPSVDGEEQAGLFFSDNLSKVLSSNCQYSQ